MPAEDERSLGQLLAALPQHISALVRAEIAQMKAEVGYKVKMFGIGGGMFAAALFVAMFLLGTLIAAAILAFALIMPAWAAALTVSGILLFSIGVLVYFGIRSFKRGSEPLESIENLRRDIDALKGIGDYDRRR